MKIKKIALPLLLGAAALSIASCNNAQKADPTKIPYSDIEIEEQDPAKYYDVVAKDYDQYFGNQLNLKTVKRDTGLDLTKATDGKFIANGIAKVKLKSYTDGDTAVFYLNSESDTYTVKDKSYPYITLRFLGIDTPESTSSIDPWGKAASKYGKELLTNAEGIIIDAKDKVQAGEATTNYANRLDSNGTRWLGLVWYCPKGMDPTDPSQYRSYQLDMIEACFTEGVVFGSKTNALTFKDDQPVMKSRYQIVKNLITGEDEKRYGSIKIDELFYEAGQRMSFLGKRVHGEIDPSFDYSTTPTKMTITEAYEKQTELMSKGTYVELTGVITRFVGTNFYFEDAQGKALYVYMGIDGNAIDRLFNVGDTISIRGRICEYGGQLQMSGIVFKKETFTKITGENAIAMPEAVNIDNMPFEEMLNYMGRLVTRTITVSNVGSQSKDGAYSLTDNKAMDDYLYAYKQSDGSIKMFKKDASPTGTLISTDDQYNADRIQARINGCLGSTYPHGSVKNGDKVTITGILSIYAEDDYTMDYKYASYQIVVGNPRVDENGNVINEIVKNS